MYWPAIVLTIPLLAVTFVLITEIGLGILPAKSADGFALTVDLLVMIPAHNEELQIAETVRSIRSECSDDTRILVVADNCTDQTANTARIAGAEVLERADTERVGKGYALDYGRSHIQHPFPDCVIILDADTRPRRGSLAILAGRAITTGQPVQACYVLEVSPHAPAISKFSAAAFLVKNQIRQLGAMRMGAPAILTGSGMGFPWPTFAELPLATGHVAEDLMLGVSCALRNRPPIFLPQAYVAGTTSSEAGTRTQRRRWESGFLATAREFTVPLLRAAITEARPAMAWLALHLITPPLLLVLAINVSVIMLLSVLTFFGMAPWPLIWLSLMTLTLGVVTVASISISGHGDLLTDWKEIPAYILWKLKVSLSVLWRRERRWIRTERD